MFPQLENAQIDWNSNHPSSAQFGDVYFDRENGLEESEYVFLRHNHLDTRFAAFNDSSESHFTIAETGFGTGLNFLQAWTLWKEKVKRPHARLHFISFERWPLSKDDLAKSLSSWPSLQHLSSMLLEQYPPSVQGLHRLVLDDGRIRLSLYLGDAEEQMAKAVFQANAWFLDGFAPAKNPELWTPRLFELIAARTAPDATIASFTSAGAIRRSLQDVGFALERVKGFGRKREMLSGHFQTESRPLANRLNREVPWSLPPTHRSATRKAIVIGAGLAGAHSAWALHNRGWSVSIYDRRGVGQEASGNPQGVLYTKIGIEYSQQTRLQLASLLFAQRFYQQHKDLFAPDAWNPCGVIQMADNDAEQVRQRKFLERNQYPREILRAVTAEEASNLAGHRLTRGGLFFPYSGALQPAEICRGLIRATGQDVRVSNIESLQYHESSQQWVLYDTEGSELDRAPLVILACATASSTLVPGGGLPFKDIRGQITQVEAPSSLQLKTVICGEGYVAPASQGMLCTGATFQHRNPDPHPTLADHRSNLAQLERLLPDLKDWIESLSSEALRGRVGFRCSTPDYLPAVGLLPNRLAMEEYWHQAKPTFANESSEHPYWPGLYVSAGHGSKGLATAPLAAEILADLINGEPLAVEADLAKALNPMRFVINRLVRSG